MPRKTTIRDIARLAGVSTATISRVLNQKPGVDAETRERVLRIVQEQGYVPSMTASSLAGGRSRLLGVLVPSLTWPLMPNIMQGMAEVVEQTDYELVLYSISHRTDRSAFIDRILAARLIDGLIAAYPDGDARAETAGDVDRHASHHLEALYQQGFPVVILDDQSLPGKTPWVGPDNRVGAYEAIQHLVRLGHRRIAYIQGPVQYQCSHDRYAGYRQALEQAQIAVDPALVVQGDFTTHSGRDAAIHLLSLPDRPSAVFAANDQMAHGVLAVAREQGLRLPEDLAVIGFDDTMLAANTLPPLTTVRQPFEDMGKSAAELLLALIDVPRMLGPGWQNLVTHLTRARGAGGADPMHVQLPTKLVVRQSCGTYLHARVDELAVPVD